MPILDIGYREWQGERSPAWTRAWVVASTGVSLVWRGMWIKRLLMLMVMPSLVAAIFVAIFEQFASSSTTQNEVVRMILSGPSSSQMAREAGLSLDEIREDPSKARHFAWTYILFVLFRYPQSVGMILLVGLVAPRLISFDLRSRGYLLYLSRPLTPGEYVIGKAGVLCVLLFSIVTLPSLAIYLAGLCLSTDPGAIWVTWDIPFRIIAASVVLILPTTAIALALSSLTQESRYAGFSWFAVWILGQVTYSAMWAATEMIRTQAQGYRAGEFISTKYSPVIMFSPYESLGYIQKQVFSLLPAGESRLEPWILMIAVTIIGYSIAYWRVARTLKA
ncbi:MAG: ABC transporter permease [Pirellula sp.]|jgi:ABC-type transport system involved in multi-copper enzyme maturation permease subunit|nr:ABC transporter permease [Pirellula sp.]